MTADSPHPVFRIDGRGAPAGNRLRDVKRVVGAVIGLAVVVLVLLLPAFIWDVSIADESVEETSISQYVADFDVAADGSMAVTETLTVDFPFSGKHGIFRFFDVADENAPTLRRIPEDVSVSLDGRPEDFEILEEEHGRYHVVKIGSAVRTIDPGQHVYVISYTIDDVLIDGEGDGSRFYWNLVPGGWRQAITRADLSVQLPAEAGDVRCAVGAGSADGCTTKGDGTTTLRVTAGPLEPNTPVTLSTQLAVPVPETQGTTRPWPPSLDPVLGHPVALALVLLLAAGAGVWGARLGARSREENPSFPLVYAPPDGIGPAQAKYILTEEVDREAFVASIMFAAEKGAVDLSRQGDSWALTDKGGEAGWANVDPVTGSVAKLLHGPGTTFVADKKDVKAGKRLKKRIEAFEQDTQEWAQSSGLMVSSGLGGLGGTMVIGSVIAVLALAIWNPLGMSAVGLVPGAFAVCGASLVRTGSGTRRTRSGRDLWSRVGGFHRILSTPSAEQRFDFSGRQELYTAYVPWAVAFGCADQWAAKYQTETGAEPPSPDYLGGAYAGSYIGNSVNDMVGDFSDTLDSAISSYEATQSSSSSSGGGFSGGGGGGGGGGGSW